MDGVRISQVAEELGVTPQYLRILEWEGRIPAVGRDYNGRVYTPFDIVLLKSMGVGRRPAKLKQPETLLQEAR